MNSPHMNELVAQRLSRRTALKLSFFAGATVAAGSMPLLNAVTAHAATGTKASGIPKAAIDLIGFEPIVPTVQDDIVLPPGFSYNVVRKWGDYQVGGEVFGENCDYNAYFPIDFLSGGNSSSEGILWTNNEYYNPLLVSKRAFNANPNFEQYVLERSMVGGSISHVKQNAGGGWEFVDDPSINRRVTGWTLCKLDGPAAGSGAVFGATEVQGSVGNCGGGYTPWGTALSGEENTDGYGDPAPNGYGWGKSDTDDRYFVKEHHGYVVEIDPFNKNSQPVKHTAIGRFVHEGATCTVGKSGKVVVYSGYDANDQPVFKFISEKVYNPSAPRSEHLTLLSSGKLYAADFANGRWLEISPNNSRIAARYPDIASVLVNAGPAAILAGATRTDRPEDIKISPLDNSVFIAMTNNTGHGNFHGHITRIFEAGGDAESLTFDWEIFATGGSQVGSGFSAPDNLEFDTKGNLWVFTDISSSRVGRGIYKFAGANGVWVIPSTGDFVGQAFHFASMPIESEVTGPSWTPNRKTLFWSVQHPGEESPALDKLTSHWPEGGDALPKSSVVAVRGF
jgi:uncharacterized protein